MKRRKVTRAAVRKRPVAEPRSPLFAAHAAWVKAGAQIAATDAQPERFTDRQCRDALGAVITAEWQMIRTPAVDLADVRLRAAVVGKMFAYAAEVGPPIDNRHLTMLAVLLREIAEYTP